ncbi:MAG: hypothetical protein CMD19_03540 [Flavobacteriales bacterium]|nr:hypothetical protein [Flavobacteriales bacterium]|tara:strand:- start:2129 stop:4150 length:2022 start_codon:yes stop_codon:yes gene_type:complete
MKRLLSILLVTLLLFACKNELESPNWDVEMIIPLVHTKMNIDNILSDTNLNILESNEGFIHLVYEENIIDINLDTLIKIDAITDEQTHTLDSASFADVVISDTATIGETISEIPLGTLLFPDGSTNNIPALFSVASGDTINIDASEYFETMNLYRGMLIVEIMNGYPTDISNVSLTLINATNQSIIATFSFPLIPSGNIASDSVSIAGQTIDDNLFAILNNMDINASNGPVLIDYSDAIITTINISDLGITEATAIFPEQQLTETLKENNFDLGGAQIEEIGIKEGTVTVNVLSTLPNGKMVYNIPSLTKNGIPFTTGDMIIPEATNTNLTSFSFNFEGYILDLTGQEGRSGGDTINTIYTESYTFIDYTGTLETINYTDSFYSFVEFDLTTAYAKGYMGQDTIEIEPMENNLNFFNNISANSLELEEVDLKLNIDNYIGADLQLNLLELKVINDRTNEEVNLADNEILDVNTATLSNNNLPINHTINELIIPAEDFVSILPNKVISTASIYLNPNGQTSAQGFFYPEYPIQANMSIDIPLSLFAENLTFIDTAEVNLPNSDEYIIEKVYLKIENGLPFESNIKLILLDENNLIIDTLLNNAIINAAQVDENNMVVNSTNTNLEIEYNDFTSVKKMISHSAFTTRPINQFIDIYSHYEIDINLSVKISNTIGK